VLGIKGTLSVVELKVLRQRLLAGQEAKARRGELFKRLPVGYARDPAGKIMFYPDRRVCEAVQLMFAKFRELWSVRQTFRWFRDHDLELPANPIQGTRLIWKIPSQSLVRDILRNPFYAGAYVWGRRPVTTLLVGGRLEKRQSATRPAEECRVFIRDHHVGYIDWATYEENQRMMRRNSVNREGDESMAAIRAGQGLLVGLLRCGHCGRKLHVRYWGGRGTHARYLCMGDYDDGGQYCIGFGGSLVDRRVGQELLKVIAPLGVEASLRALEELNAGATAQRAALSRKLEQLAYEAKKAFEQYDAVDARNRLAASELERRWNEKLEEIEAVRPCHLRWMHDVFGNCVTLFDFDASSTRMDHLIGVQQRRGLDRAQKILSRRGEAEICCSWRTTEPRELPEPRGSHGPCSSRLCHHSSLIAHRRRGPGRRSSKAHR
jgi:Recombinase/Recombinase zinc beta ribbon domain